MLNRSKTWAVVFLVATFAAGLAVGAGGRAPWVRYASAAAPDRGRGLGRMRDELTEAVRRALDVQPSIVQARGDVRTAGADQRSAAGAFLPTITASGSSNLASTSRYNAATGQIVTVPSNTSYSGSLGLSLDLFDGFQRLANKRAAAATEDAADAGLINQRYQVTATTAQLFFPALADEELVRVAEAQLQQAEARARAAGAQVGAARSQYWPTLSASYANGYTGLDSLGRLGLAPWSTTQRYVNNWALRFSLSWTLFNGFTREANQVTVSVAQDVARAAAADTRRQVGAQLTQQLAAVTTAYAQFGITGANVAAATEALRVTQERYKLGAGTLLDLLPAEANMTQAQVNQVQSRYNYLIARAQAEALVGHPL